MNQRSFTKLAFTGISVLILSIVLTLCTILTIPKSENDNTGHKSVIYNQKQAADQSVNEFGELLLVQFLFRHGARTPVAIIDPADGYANFSWPEGLGGLTKNGKLNMFLYGQTLSKRYETYLKSVLTRNIIAQSSPIHRCIESVNSVLGGMMPPSNSTQIWNQNLLIAKEWQPIAVSTVEYSRSWLLGDGFSCPKAKQIESNANNLTELNELLSQNADFLQQFTNLTNINATGSNWNKVLSIKDAYVCEEDYFGSQYVKPKWMDNVGQNFWLKMKELGDFAFNLSHFYPEPYLKLKVGPILKELINNMNQTSKQTNVTIENRSVYVYGTHDTVLSRVLNAFQMFKEQPRFGSGLIFELRKDSQTLNPNVHLFYANLTNLNSDIYAVPLNETDTFSKLCGNVYCDLNSFIESLRKYLPEEDIEKECAL